MVRQNPYHSSGLGFPAPGEPLLVEVTRGMERESLHRVHAVLSDAQGNLRGVWGNSNLGFFPRSAVKLIQAMGFLLHPNLGEISEQELAIACASHLGEARQVDLVRSWLAREGFSESDLECGSQEPTNQEAARALQRKGEPFCSLHNNCSGKHAGMLLGCRLHGFPLQGYTNYDHPYQILQRDYFTKFFDLDFGALPWGIDGCSLPTYKLPLRSLALAQARIAMPKKLDSQIQGALARALRAIKNQPYFLGGEESLCSHLVAGTPGLAIVKGGAEGVYGASFPELGLGLALKCEDGGQRAVQVAMAHFLRYLGISYTAASERWSWENLLSPKIKNWRGEVVGEIRLSSAASIVHANGGKAPL